MGSGLQILTRDCALAAAALYQHMFRTSSGPGWSGDGIGEGNPNPEGESRAGNAIPEEAPAAPPSSDGHGSSGGVTATFQVGQMLLALLVLRNWIPFCILRSAVCGLLGTLMDDR